jgi:hypothetical protein
MAVTNLLAQSCNKADNAIKLVTSIDILYTLDSASNYSAIQKLKPRLQSQIVPMK